MSLRRIALVGCGASKLDHAAKARELYTGSLFRAARADVEARGIPWAIVSAKHGLLLPDDVVEPYDLTIRQRRDADRRDRAHPWESPDGWGGPWSWPNLLLSSLTTWLWYGRRYVDERLAVPGTPFVVELHAGKDYVDAIRTGLEHYAPGAADPERRRHPAARLLTLEEPLQGLMLGERLGAYASRRRFAAEATCTA